MTDIRNAKLMYVKALLLLFVGLLASGILVLEHPNPRFVSLLAIAIWGFCRAYYFAFYVIQHYVDPSFRYAGLWAFVRYSLPKRRGGRSDHGE